MCFLSAELSKSSKCTTPPLAVLRTTMAAAACGFGWALPEFNVDDCGGCPFQMAGSFNMHHNTTTSAVRNKLLETFARFGLPEQIVTDNGRQFASNEFIQFCKNNCIRNVFSSAYHPRSNGEAERFVRTFKEGSVQLTFLWNSGYNGSFLDTVPPHTAQLVQVQPRSSCKGNRDPCSTS